MSAQGSPLPPSSYIDSRGPRGRFAARTFALPLAAVLAAGAACVWAARRAAATDRPLVTAAGALAAGLLGLVVALAASRRRMAGELRLRTEVLRDEAARTVALHADAVTRAETNLEGAQRAVRKAEAQRRAAAEAEVSLRTALRAETARATALEGESAQLADVTVPLAVERLRDGGSADTVLSRLPQPAQAAHRRLLDVLIREIGASERMRAAAMTACASAAGRVQALTTSMLADLREMEGRHEEQMLGDLLHLDHCTAQAGRLADSVAVLTGARSGRRWTKPIVMESVLRGAMGRIHAYPRVRLHSASTAAVAGHAAEGVMHALAELMDNACNFSPPTEDVHVYVQETRPGVVVTIEDAGLAMPDATLARAEKLVSGDPLDVRSLSGTRLGFAVVGSLVRKYGLRVSFRPSSRGGTGVVMLIPAKIVTRLPEGYDGLPQTGAPPARDGRDGREGGSAGLDERDVRDGRDRQDAHGGRGGQGGRDGLAVPTGAGGPGGPGVPVGPAGPPGQVDTGGWDLADLAVDAQRAAEAGRGRRRERSPAHARPETDLDTGGTPMSKATRGGAAAEPDEDVPSLPKRLRGQTLAASPHEGQAAGPGQPRPEPSPQEEDRAARSRAEAGSRFTAFRDAATGGVRTTGGRTAEHSASRNDAAPDRAGDRTNAGERTNSGPGGGGWDEGDTAPEQPAEDRTDSRHGGAGHAGAAEGPRPKVPRTPSGGSETVEAGGDTGR
jgi:signal transduction histidine kinase